MGPSWARLGWSWAALGRSLGLFFSFLGALGRVLGALRLQRPFQEQFSLNLCCFLGGPNLEKYRFYLGKTMIFRKSLFCSWAVFGTLPEPILGGFWSLKLRSWAVLGRSGEVLGGVGWCVVGCCVVLCGLGWSWVRSWVGLGGRTVPNLHDRGSPRVAQRSKGSLGWMAPPRSDAFAWG